MAVRGPPGQVRLQRQEGGLGLDPGQGLHQVVEEAASFGQGHLLIIKQAHRPQHQDQAAGAQVPGEFFLKQPGQLMTGEGPGHLYPGQEIRRRQTTPPALPHHQVGVKPVGRVHRQHLTSLGYPPGRGGRGQKPDGLAPQQYPPPRSKRPQAAAYRGHLLHAASRER